MLRESYIEGSDTALVKLAGASGIPFSQLKKALRQAADSASGSSVFGGASRTPQYYQRLRRFSGGNPDYEAHREIISALAGNREELALNRYVKMLREDNNMHADLANAVRSMAGG